VGGGVTGLACARVVAQAGLVVRVLEARRIGSGASGRNGGFALRGTSAPYDRARLPDVMRLTEEALERIRDVAGDAFRAVGSLRVAVDQEELAALRGEHDALAADGFEVEWRDADRLPPVLRDHARGAIFHPTDGAFEQGAWIRRLAALAHDAGARLAEQTAVTALQTTSARTADGAVHADCLVVATDGYTHDLVPELDAAVAAVRGQVLATEPLPERLLPCPIYARWGYDYMQQLADRRLVVGGRRDADLEGETTSVEEATDRIQERIEAHARSVFGSLPPVTHRWAGLMGFTDDYLPLVGELPGRPGVWASVGYSGHGNVLGFACGEAVGRAILGDPDPRLAPLSPGRILAARPPA
jgi:gamma-glutamylputrescine oxidase